MHVEVDGPDACSLTTGKFPSPPLTKLLQDPRNHASDVPLGVRLEMPRSSAAKVRLSKALRKDLGTAA